MDFDPDGIAIMSTYKHGSFNLSHENEQLNVGRLQWLGVRCQDILSKPAGASGCDDARTVVMEPAGLLRLSARDRKKAAKMLENSEVFREEEKGARGAERQWRGELQVMLMLNVKAEMEILAEREGGVVGWVRDRLVEEVGLPTPLTQTRPWLL